MTTNNIKLTRDEKRGGIAMAGLIVSFLALAFWILPEIHWGVNLFISICIGGGIYQGLLEMDATKRMADGDQEQK